MQERKQRFHYGWLILAYGVLTTMSALGLARFGYTMILPSMQEGLGLTNTQTGALATGNFIGYLALALIGGFLASHYSPRKVITVSLLIVALSILATGVTRSFTGALFCRVLTGMGSGGSNVPMMGLLAAWFAPKRRGLATGLAVSGSSLGLIITGPIVPAILNNYPDKGWRYSWYILGLIILVVGLSAYFILRDSPSSKKLLPIGHIEKSSAEMAKPQPIKGFGHVYWSRTVWKLSVVYIAFGFSYIIYTTYFAKYLESEIGYTKERAGQLWQFVGWISILCGLLWGWVSDYIGRKLTLCLVSLIQTFAYLSFALWTSDAGLLASAIAFGLTAWSIPAIMASACGDHLGPKFASAALGFVTLFMGIGQALGPSVAGMIADQTGSFVAAFVVAAAAAFIGALASLMLRPTVCEE